MAKPIPVLPDDDSMMTWPGFSVPSFSASSTIDRAMRSFTEPPGFWPSSLARMRTDGFGLRALTSTSGVLPISSSTLPRTAIGAPFLPAGDGRQDRDHGVVADLGVELVQVPDVVVVQVDV